MALVLDQAPKMFLLLHRSEMEKGNKEEVVEKRKEKKAARKVTIRSCLAPHERRKCRRLQSANKLREATTAFSA
jgi:hypothetical protein